MTAGKSLMGEIREYPLHEKRIAGYENLQFFYLVFLLLIPHSFVLFLFPFMLTLQA